MRKILFGLALLMLAGSPALAKEFNTQGQAEGGPYGQYSAYRGGLEGPGSAENGAATAERMPGSAQRSESYEGAEREPGRLAGRAPSAEPQARSEERSGAPETLPGQSAAPAAGEDGQGPAARDQGPINEQGEQQMGQGRGARSCLPNQSNAAGRGDNPCAT